jgi:hypothetical protein
MSILVAVDPDLVPNVRIKPKRIRPDLDPQHRLQQQFSSSISIKKIRCCKAQYVKITRIYKVNAKSSPVRGWTASELLKYKLV